MSTSDTAGTAREGMTMSEWVDAPTGPGRWWRCVGATAPVLCRVSGDAAGLSVERVDGIEVLYLVTPFAGVKWRRDVPVSAEETTRLRALLPKLALPWRAAVRATEGELRLGPFSLDTALAVIDAVNALPGLLDAAERAEREHREAGESTRAAWRESERREQELRDRLIAAERERDDLAATLETRTAEHALAMERVRELEARLTAARKATEDLPRHLGASWWGQQLRAALVEPTAEVSRG